MDDDDQPSDFEPNQQASNRGHQAPYSKRHPVPTVQHYKQVRQEREDLNTGSDGHSEQGRKRDGVKRLLGLGGKTEQGDSNAQGWSDQGYNRNEAAYHAESQYLHGNSSHREEPAQDGRPSAGQNEGDSDANETDDSAGDEQPVDTSEAISGETDPRKKRKAMKGRDPEKNKKSRKVTDPITHLPITIHDFTEKELNDAPENVPSLGAQPRTATGLSAESKSQDQLNAEQDEIDRGSRGMQKLFPPPSLEALKAEIGGVYVVAFTVCIAIMGTTMLLSLGMAYWLGRKRSDSKALQFTALGTILIGVLTSAFAAFLCRGWLASKINSIWQDDMWDNARRQERREQHKLQIPESAMWLNSTVASIWPLINPDLFASMVDTLEDVMQASLPKVVRMIAIEDFGQGKSPLRILGVRWLPSGAAAKSVSKDGKFQSQNHGKSDREDPDKGQVEKGGDDKDSKKSKDDGEDESQLSEGLEAESGDFMNLELSFSYRATAKGKSLKDKTQNAHMYLVFYLPANIPVPVWVAIDGIVGTLRLRLQTAPDPPFIKLCTLSFMGQPRASMSCVPLVKRGPNIMDLPLISSFVQSSVDAALAEYVAPKSLTIDLEQMLKGDDFKKDTLARGALFVRVRWADGMKEGDSSIPLLKDGSSDCYVSCGWAKFSKPMWSTRIIISDMKPSWEEHCILLIGPEELNASERLRLQLWDSDRSSADDDLGRIEVDLEELMNNENSKGKLWAREDEFVGLDGDSSMPGKLSWEVGYFAKMDITADQLDKQQVQPEIRTVKQLKDKVKESTKRKLREAPHKIRTEEENQTQAQEYEDEQHKLICAAPPPEEYFSGILSIEVHNATGLEITSLRKKTKSEEEDSEKFEDDLPSPFCNIIINGKIIYKTRTKPKNSNPFFNAGTERFIRDWRDAQVIVAMRDARVHENDPLLGIVYLPLEHLLRARSQVNDTYPISGGIGCGRLRVSVVFRAVNLQFPPQLRGWDYGTLQLEPAVSASQGLPEDLKVMRLKVHTNINRAKLKSNKDGTWRDNKGRQIHLAVQRRYSSAMIIEFRSDRTLKDKTAAWAILWLKDIPDDVDQELELPVWRGDKKQFKRASDNVLEEMGERAGSIKVQLKLFAGLSDYHRKLNDSNVKNVLECLDVASDNKDLPDDGEESTSGSGSGSDSGSDSDGESKSTRLSSKTSKSDDHSRVGPIKAAKDYKNESKTLHRQHRGVMQWKLARTADWMHTKVKDDMGGKVKKAFQRKGRDQGIETEV